MAGFPFGNQIRPDRQHIDEVTAKGTFVGTRYSEAAMKLAGRLRISKPTGSTRRQSYQLYLFFDPAARRLAAHLAFIRAESFRRPAAVSPPFFFALGAACPPFFFDPPALRLAAHLAFIRAESFRRPAAVSPPFLFPFGAAAVRPPFLFAQRALAAAASLARVAADIGRRAPERADDLEPPVPKIEVRRFWAASIWRRNEIASCSCVIDKSIGEISRPT